MIKKNENNKQNSIDFLMHHLTPYYWVDEQCKLILECVDY
jgi:hypothetical protein